MSKPEQILRIEPQNELRFRGPFNNAVTSYMKLTNPSDKDVLYKIKTTAPKKYCVRPNSGILNPYSTIEIAICLQPFVFDPAEKNKHKFMVQTVFPPEGDFNVDQLWKEIGADQLMDSKLKCVFEMPADGEPGKSANATTDDASSTAGKTASGGSPGSGAKSDSSSNATMLTAGGGTLHEEGELKRAAAEIQKLREEESQLRNENIRLQEMVLQLKESSKNAAAGSGGSAPANRYAPPAAQAQRFPLPMEHVVVAVLLGILGMILGKFVL